MIALAGQEVGQLRADDSRRPGGSLYCPDEPDSDLFVLAGASDRFVAAR